MSSRYSPLSLCWWLLPRANFSSGSLPEERRIWPRREIRITTSYTTACSNWCSRLLLNWWRRSERHQSFAAVSALVVPKMLYSFIVLLHKIYGASESHFWKYTPLVGTQQLKERTTCHREYRFDVCENLVTLWVAKRIADSRWNSVT